MKSQVAIATIPSTSAVPGSLIGLPRVLQLVGLGRSAWLARVKAGEAPANVKIGRRSLWVEGEVRDYLADCVRRHREGGSK